MLSLNRKSARAIALRADMSVSEKREMMEMLGLIEVGGRVVLPDERQGISHPTGMNQQTKGSLGAKDPDDMRVPPRRSSAPAGLRASRGAAGDTPAVPVGAAE